MYNISVTNRRDEDEHRGKKAVKERKDSSKQKNRPRDK